MTHKTTIILALLATLTGCTQETHMLKCSGVMQAGCCWIGYSNTTNSPEKAAQDMLFLHLPEGKTLTNKECHRAKTGLIHCKIKVKGCKKEKTETMPACMNHNKKDEIINIQLQCTK